jgi:hypothetical protein
VYAGNAVLLDDSALRANPLAIKCLSINLQRGGVLTARGERDPIDRWSILTELVRESNADIVCVQEGADWNKWSKRAPTAERAFSQPDAPRDMRALIAPSSSGGATGVFFRQSRFLYDDWAIRDAHMSYHGFGWACLRLQDDPDIALSVISIHYCPFSYHQALIEVGFTATRLFACGGAGVMLGDINYAQRGDPKPDFSNFTDFNYGARTKRTKKGKTVLNYEIADLLSNYRLTDVAGYLADQTGDQSLRLPTGHGGLRVDQQLVTRAMRPTIVSYRTIRTDGSDHDATEAWYDLSKLDRTLLRDWE